MLDHIFPEEYHRHLSRLLANTPRSSWEAVRRVIKQDLGDTPTSFAVPIHPISHHLLSHSYLQALHPMRFLNHTITQSPLIPPPIHPPIGKEPEDLFSSIEHEPIASASLAQVLHPHTFTPCHHIYSLIQFHTSSHLLNISLQHWNRYTLLTTKMVANVQ